MVSRMILQRWGRGYPERTFPGRERVSLAPRWITNWLLVGSVIYMIGRYALGLMGYSNMIPFQAKPTETPFPTATKTMMPPVESFHSSTGAGVKSTLLPPVRAAVDKIAPLPTYTPYPSPSPYPSPTPAPLAGEYIAVGYSYYWPPWGPPNCHSDNWDEKYNICKDTTASGKKWTEYIGRGVAVPIQWAERVPLGSRLHVWSPESMVGDYTVIDYCGGCIKPEGHIYIDFLDNYQRLNWTVPMLIQILP